MNKEELKLMSSEKICDFIRNRLEFNPSVSSSLRYVDTEVFKKEHKRFEMSGYERETGECTLHNMSILNLFADLGIYDYTEYLFLDFYKGSGTLYFKHFHNHDDESQEIDYEGEGTVEIIYDIFRLTILSDKPTRRRS